MKLLKIFISVCIAILVTVQAPDAATVYFSDFESDNGGLTGTLDWEWGRYAWDGSGCSYTPHPPPGAYSGSNMWGTVLNDCHSPLDNADNGSTCNNVDPWDDSILTLKIDLSGLTDAELSWWDWYDLFSNFDWAEVRLDGNVIFQHCYSSFVEPTSWKNQKVNLTPYVGRVVEITFHSMATTVVEYSGWYIDDLGVTSSSILTPTPTGIPYTPTPAGTLKIPSSNASGRGVLLILLGIVSLAALLVGRSRW